MPRVTVLIPFLSLDSAYKQPGSTGEGLSNWVPATQMRGSNWGAGSWLQPKHLQVFSEYTEISVWLSTYSYLSTWLYFYLPINIFKIEYEKIFCTKKVWLLIWFDLHSQINILINSTKLSHLKQHVKLTFKVCENHLSHSPTDLVGYCKQWLWGERKEHREQIVRCCQTFETMLCQDYSWLLLSQNGNIKALLIQASASHIKESLNL